jgi:hypothetical protein
MGFVEQVRYIFKGEPTLPEDQFRLGAIPFEMRGKPAP